MLIYQPFRDALNEVGNFSSSRYVIKKNENKIVGVFDTDDTTTEYFNSVDLFRLGGKVPVVGVDADAIRIPSVFMLSNRISLDNDFIENLVNTDTRCKFNLSNKVFIIFDLECDSLYLGDEFLCSFSKWISYVDICQVTVEDDRYILTFDFLIDRSYPHLISMSFDREYNLEFITNVFPILDKVNKKYRGIFNKSKLLFC